MGIMVNHQYDTESFQAKLINVKQVNRNIDSAKWNQMLTNTTIPFDLPDEGSKSPSRSSTNTVWST